MNIHCPRSMVVSCCSLTPAPARAISARRQAERRVGPRSMAGFRRRLRTTLVAAPRVAALVAALLVASTSGASAGSVAVRVLDGRDSAPIEGAYVQIGTAPGTPFSGNIAFTGPDGRVAFDDPAILGPQTVTAAEDGFGRVSLLDSVTDSVTIRLARERPAGGIFGPKAELSGTVTNISVQNNDGNFDIGFVYPALPIVDLLRGSDLPIEVPADTVNFPVVGQVVLPGNVVVPSQIEFLVFNFSKPLYHFFVGDLANYDFVSLAARIPISALELPPEQALNQAVMREIGIERNIAMAGDRNLTINSDLDLTRNLTVNVPEAPNGSTIQVASVADVPHPAGVRTIYFDLKSGLADVMDSFLLSGRNPLGDLSDAVPYLAGSYADSSAADGFSAGRVDRASLVLPATRNLGEFFLLPDLAQSGPQYLWSDVARSGVTPDPTWALASFRLEPTTPEDPGVETLDLWEVWSTADAGLLTLPTLSGSAPGGIPDVGNTPESDQIVWDHLLADAAGDIQQVLDESITSATRFSRRKIAVTPATTSVSATIPPKKRRELAFRVSPNPVANDLRVLWSEPSQSGEPVRWTLTDVSGRRVRTGEFETSGSALEVIGSPRDLTIGMYWLRLHRGRQTGVTRVAIGVR